MGSNKQCFLNDGLHYAVKKNDIHLVKTFTNLGADLNSESNFSPLGYAYKCESYDIFRYLLDHGANGQEFLDCVFPDSGVQRRLHLYADGLKKHPEILRLLLDKGARPNVNSEKWSMLFYLSSWRDDYDDLAEQWLQLLLECGSLNLVNEFERFEGKSMTVDGHVLQYYSDHRRAPFIYMAASRLPVECLRKILEAGAQINVFAGHIGSKDYCTPLHSVSEMDSNIDKVKLLLEHGAVYVKDSSGRYPGDVAFQCSAIKILQFYKQEGYTCSAFDKYKLHIACIMEDKAEVRNLINEGVDVNTLDTLHRSPLSIAIMKDNMTLINILLKEGVDVNGLDTQHRSPLSIAIEKDNKALINILLKEGADVNGLDTQHRSPLYTAIEKDNMALIKILLKEGADVNGLDTRHRSPLSIAIEKDNMALIKILIEAGVNPNPEITSAWKDVSYIDEIHPMRMAVKKGKVELVKYFIEVLGDQLDINEGYVNYHCGEKHRQLLTLRAVQSRSLEMVQLLLKHGADFSVVDPCSGFTPLFAAVSHGCDVNLLKLLLEHGARVNDTVRYNSSERGKSALHVCQRVDCIDLLLEHGADPYVGRVVAPEDGVKKPPYTTLLLLSMNCFSYFGLEYFQMIWEAKKELLKDEFILLHRASEKGCCSFVKYLVTQNPDWYSQIDRSKFPEMLLKLGLTFNFNSEKGQDSSAELYMKSRFLFTRILQGSCGSSGNVDGLKLLESLHENKDYTMLALIRDLGYHIQESQLSQLTPSNVSGDNELEAGRKSVDQFVSVVKDIFSQPRSLQNICRVKIRRVLMDAKALYCPINDAIQALHLPEPIEQFLSFTDHEELAYLRVKGIPQY